MKIKAKKSKDKVKSKKKKDKVKAKAKPEKIAKVKAVKTAKEPVAKDSIYVDIASLKALKLALMPEKEHTPLVATKYFLVHMDSKKDCARITATNGKIIASLGLPGQEIKADVLLIPSAFTVTTAGIKGIINISWAGDTITKPVSYTHLTLPTNREV